MYFTRLLTITASALAICTAAQASEKPKELMPIPGETTYNRSAYSEMTLRPLLATHMEPGRFEPGLEPILQDPEARKAFLLMLYESQRSLQSRDGESARRYIQRAIDQLDQQISEQDGKPAESGQQTAGKSRVTSGIAQQGNASPYVEFSLANPSLHGQLELIKRRIELGKFHQATYDIRSVRDAFTENPTERQFAERDGDIS